MTMKHIQLFILFAMLCISISTFGKALVWNYPVSINDQSIDPVRNDKKENINGKWFIPHNAGVNIIFRNDGSFVFNDYNAKKHCDEILTCLLYTSDAADDMQCVDLGGRRIIKKKKKIKQRKITKKQKNKSMRQIIKYVFITK
eukprot:TRINITY_DN6360_c0_g1_i2.p1 TRINITY_DN6360_c0_g1~~TRINITY_DN6360_c0_g1_i2.p1  ORF type:complete len:143 (+),score=28.75 TRINITY_DN6360_c0_g1_i2:334-762(+)